MAAPTSLTANTSATDASSYATASISPSANALLIAGINNQKGSTPDTPTCSGLSLSWTQLDSSLPYDSIASPTDRLTVFYAVTGASPGSGAITFDFGGVNQTGAAWAVAEWTGVDTGGPIGVTSSNSQDDTSTTLTVTLGAFSDAGNGTFGVFGNADGSTTTPGTGFTELSDTSSSDPFCGIQMEYRTDNDTTVTASYPANRFAAGVGFEVVMAGGGGGGSTSHIHLPVLGVG